MSTDRKKHQIKVTIVPVERISEEEAQRKLDAAFAILFEEVLKRRKAAAKNLI